MKQLIQAAEQSVVRNGPLQICLTRGCPNEQKITHQTRVQKKCFKLLLERLVAFKFYQTRTNTIKHIMKHDQTGVQTVNCLVSKQCLMVFGRH